MLKIRRSNYLFWVKFSQYDLWISNYYRMVGPTRHMGGKKNPLRVKFFVSKFAETSAASTQLGRAAVRYIN